jgi:BirA family biotin operon repressor/biotin-[acetyl-CoA-carboxylase] ligase
METSRADSAQVAPPPWATPWPGASVFLKETTSSTMSDARALAREDCPTGTVAAALYQAGGRGRVPGRTWQAPAGSSLLATVVLRVKDLGYPAGELPLRAGVAAALGVEAVSGAAVGIKWPNDLLWSGRKLAGLLCEAYGDVALVGIGVNCSQVSFPPELENRACSLLQACGRLITPPTVLSAILRELKASPGLGPWRDELRSRLHRRGQMVSVNLLGSDSTVTGRLLDVDEAGRLVLELPDGRRRAFAQGELGASPG